ncbi:MULTISPECIES: GlxA family transcriptional regulator [Sinorhizobium]|uniref:AraC family transcriptional regulator n=2 Tax=Sinorhizobium TaxID=28105 RepID=A0A2S3YU67_9HYPH|nr:MULTISPECIES: GlxA family transcriptional regulator [Sinorhizobium]ASY55239.1 Transcriptional regulator containing an amidase domain and an AraC-type DNA-binding HTH domain [Sinorhizobium sp. CCBAU 05631]AUX75213.1 AraC family transcriptional regulator protein [Sinorhizobium fredii]PDT38923.1 GlxA family transcriptional regulator [Sinorhizobium sp. FG01]POH35190.1 AraC family transcriptional regulator [Sinorhizobium americanum]
MRTALTETSAAAGKPLKDKGVLRVGFILARSFTLSAFSLFVDALRLGSDVEDKSGRVNCDWEVLGSTRNFVMSSCGIQVAPTAPLRPPTEFSYIAVVGGRLNVAEPLDRETTDYLHRAARAGVPIIGVCTGSFVLAEAGVLDGHAACVSWLHHNEFRGRFPAIEVTSNRIFVEDGNIITCAGGSSVADLATYLIRKHVGEDAERNALEIMQITRRREASEMQPRNPLGPVPVQDKRISLALMVMEQHLEDLIGIDDVANVLGISRRQLERLFQNELGATPISVYLKLRLDAAMRLVASTDKPLIEIALETGFENVSHFIRKFRKAFSITPAAARKQLAAARGAPGRKG